MCVCVLWWICLCVSVHARVFVSLRAALCLSSSILEAADAEQMLASVYAVERNRELLDDDAEGDAAAAPGEPDGDEDRRDEDLRMAAAVLEASPDDVRARLGHEDEVPPRGRLDSELGARRGTHCVWVRTRRACKG